MIMCLAMYYCHFFFNATATTEIYTYWHTRSLHDARPIYGRRARDPALALAGASVSARRRRGSVAVSEDSGVPQRRVRLDRQGAGQHFGARADRRPRETSVEPRDEDVREGEKPGRQDGCRAKSREIGRARCGERGGKYGESSGVSGSLKKKK